MSSAVTKWIRTQGHEVPRLQFHHVNVEKVMIYQFIKELSSVVSRTEQQTESPSGELMIWWSWRVTITHTPHSTAIRLKLRESLAIHSSQVRIIIVWLLHLQISRWDWLWHGTKSRRNIFYTQIPSSSQYHRTPSLDFGLKRFWYAMPANLPSPISKIVLNKTFREHGYMAMGDWILLKNIKKSITSIL